MASQITVTANLTDPSGSPLTGNSFVRFRLRNFQGFVPVVTGTSVICETQIDALPTAGAISQALWGNNNITPATTFYTVEFWDQGRITSTGNYLFNANTSLNTAAQLNAPPVPAGFSLVLENNGTLNSSQSTLNLESTDSSVTITDVGGGTLNLQSAAGGGVQTASVTYSSAQMLALFTSGPLALAAGIAGKVLVPLAVTFNYVYGGSVYNTTGTTSLIVGWSGLAFNSNNIATVLTSGFVNLTSNQLAISGFTDGPVGQPSSALVGKGLTFGLNTAATQNLTSGNGTVTVTVSYVAVSAS